MVFFHERPLNLNLCGLTSVNAGRSRQSISPLVLVPVQYFKVRRFNSTQWILLAWWLLLIALGPNFHRAPFFGLYSAGGCGVSCTGSVHSQAHSRAGSHCHLHGHAGHHRHGPAFTDRDSSATEVATVFKIDGLSFDDLFTNKIDRSGPSDRIIECGGGCRNCLLCQFFSQYHVIFSEFECFNSSMPNYYWHLFQQSEFVSDSVLLSGRGPPINLA